MAMNVLLDFTSQVILIDQDPEFWKQALPELLSFAQRPNAIIGCTFQITPEIY